MSVSGVVAPPITSGRTRRHRFLFLAHLKAGADLEPAFWNRSQDYLCGKPKNWFQNWNQHRPGWKRGICAVNRKEKEQQNLPQYVQSYGQVSKAALMEHKNRRLYVPLGSPLCLSIVSMCRNAGLSVSVYKCYNQIHIQYF